MKGHLEVNLFHLPLSFYETTFDDSEFPLILFLTPKLTHRHRNYSCKY